MSYGMMVAAQMDKRDEFERELGAPALQKLWDLEGRAARIGITTTACCACSRCCMRLEISACTSRSPAKRFSATSPIHTRSCGHWNGSEDESGPTMLIPSPVRGVSPSRRSRPDSSTPMSSDFHPGRLLARASDAHFNPVNGLGLFSGCDFSHPTQQFYVNERERTRLFGFRSWSQNRKRTGIRLSKGLP
jgi:hypothetical protein